MSILFYSDGDQSGDMLRALQQHLPDQTIHSWPQCWSSGAAHADITTAIVWKPPVDFFDGLSSLKQVLSISAGVELLLDHPGLPPDVQVIRLADAGMGTCMAEYVLYGVLHAHRGFNAMRKSQRSGDWNERVAVKPANDFTVGILGAGQLGQTVAQRLVINGYSVRCWSRTPKQLDKVATFAGDNALTDFAAKLDALVCLLPLTADTRGFLNAAFFAQLPAGVFLINPGRGAHLIDKELLAALASGQISGALLDVFETEPLPADHPFWAHPSIIITPHNAAPTLHNLAAKQIAESLHQLANGIAPAGLVQRLRGY